MTQEFNAFEDHAFEDHASDDASLQNETMDLASTPPESFTAEQVIVWLRGLITVAWADGKFTEAEQTLISQMVDQELAPKLPETNYEPITPAELAQSLGPKTSKAENFLRTAVMVALADGLYSPTEDQVLAAFCEALGLDTAALESLRSTLIPEPTLEETLSASPANSPIVPAQADHPSLLAPVQHWLDGLEIQDPRIARFLCKMIPPQCPFERDIELFDHKIVHIPSMCKLNPLYDQLIGLRFRALSYLADDCKEDVTPYI
jgi:tellurite resistance protein